MRPDRDLLITAYRAFNKRDIDSVLETMHHDVDWPNGMEGGRVHGHSGVRDYWLRQWTLIDPHVEPVSFEANETGQTVVHVHQIVRDLDGNLVLDQMVQHVYTIQNGLIRSMEIQGSGSN
jgi:ketosteroid isomerase-like protein